MHIPTISVWYSGSVAHPAALFQREKRVDERSDWKRAEEVPAAEAVRFES